MSPQTEFNKLYKKLTDKHGFTAIDRVSDLTSSEKEQIEKLYGTKKIAEFITSAMEFASGGFVLIGLLLGVVRFFSGGIEKVGLLPVTLFLIAPILVFVLGSLLIPTGQNTKKEDAVARISLQKLRNWYEEQQVAAIAFEIIDAIIDREQARLEDEIKQEHHASALKDAIELIVAAVRTLQPDGDNSVMLTTIDGELKSISNDPGRVHQLHGEAALLDELSLARDVMDESGVTDPFIKRRFDLIFSQS